MLLLLTAGLFQAQDLIAEVCKKQEIPFEIRQAPFKEPGRNYVVGGDIATPAAMKKYAPLWAAEWSRYSADLLDKAMVVKVVFAEKLSLNGQIRGAVPAFDLRTMYYDPALGSYAPNYQRNVVHHEFFHMLDKRMNTLYIDKQWASLNPKSFKYGPGGAKMRKLGSGELTNQIPGFLTPYGTAAVEEDKAELYSHLIVDPAFVMAQARKDTVLAKKISLLKKRLLAYDSLFSPTFWPKP